MRTLYRARLLRLVTALVCIAGLWAVAQAHQEKRESVAKGTWGGRGIQLEVRDEGAQVEFDCARGEITEPLTLDKQGHFEARGTFLRERGGPQREDEADQGEAAHYSGRVSGKTMQLTVTLARNDETIGRFTLTSGSAGRLYKCQ